MNQMKYRGVSNLTMLITVAILVILAFLIFANGSGSNSSSATNGVSTSTEQASSTVSQALQLSKWLAKEYAPQKN